MEWHKEGFSESINSLWAWSINPAKYDLPNKKIHSTHTYNCEVNNAQGLAVYGIKKFSDNFLQTSYDIISIPEHPTLIKNLHVKDIKIARVLFFKKFNNVRMRPNADVYIFRKRDGIHYSQTFEDIETHRQNKESKHTFGQMPESIFHPFE